MATEMLERVAVAIAHVAIAKSSDPVERSEEMTADDIRDLARAAISAMREATGEMVEAGAEEASPYTVTSPEWDEQCQRTCDVWDAMISVALGKGCDG